MLLNNPEDLRFLKKHRIGLVVRGLGAQESILTQGRGSNKVKMI
jgi:hypothetical protein